MQKEVVFLVDKDQITEVVDLIIMDRQYYRPSDSFLGDELERYVIHRAIERIITKMKDNPDIEMVSTYGATVIRNNVDYGSTTAIIIDVLFNPKMFDRNYETYYYSETEKGLVKGQ